MPREFASPRARSEGGEEGRCGVRRRRMERTRKRSRRDLRRRVLSGAATRMPRGARVVPCFPVVGAVLTYDRRCVVVCCPPALARHARARACVCGVYKRACCNAPHASCSCACLASPFGCRPSPPSAGFGFLRCVGFPRSPSCVSFIEVEVGELRRWRRDDRCRDGRECLGGGRRGRNALFSEGEEESRQERRHTWSGSLLPPFDQAVVKPSHLSAVVRVCVCVRARVCLRGEVRSSTEFAGG